MPVEQSNDTSMIQNRWWASLPEDDPRFTEFRRYIQAVKGSGKGSPVPRMLGELALLGFMMHQGKFAGMMSEGFQGIQGLQGVATPQEIEQIESLIGGNNEWGEFG